MDLSSRSRVRLLALALAALAAVGPARAADKAVPEIPAASIPALAPAAPAAVSADVPAELSRAGLSLPDAAPRAQAAVPALPAAAAMPAPAAQAVPAARSASPLSAVASARAGVAGQLGAMRAVVGPRHEALLEDIGRTAGAMFDQIEGHVRAGEIDPTVELRAHEQDSSKPATERELRVGVYPVAADPFHWGHMLVGLQAVARLKLDKVVFVLAGDDPRKPNMTKADIRHPMGRAVLDAFAPFFLYSPIAVGTTYDGETNIFRLLALNASQRMRAFYLVGDDHYRLTDKNGNPDTLPKIEANMSRPELGFDPSKHAVSVAFGEREGRKDQPVPTSLDVSFLPHVGFEASSTQIRNGHQALMPYAAYHFVKKAGHKLYGIE